MKSSGVIYVKKLALPALCIAFVLCLLFMSKTAVSSASRGLNLWFDIVFPSLFPFFVASEILNSLGFSKTAGILLEPVMRPLFRVPGNGSLALLMGVAGGYPAGAKITCDLREKGELTKTEAERLLAFTNNSGPLFITGAVATGMYGAPRLGFLLLACHILACLTVGFLFRFYKSGSYTAAEKQSGRILQKFRRELNKPYEREKPGIAAIFGDAVRNSVSLILAIGGFIVLFSVITGILLETGALSSLANMLSLLMSPLGLTKETLTAILSGLFEITTGSNLVSGLKGIPLEQQLPAASFVIGWAGLSVHSQVLGITGRTDISIKPYLTGKFMQGLIAAFYTWAGLKLVSPEVWLAKPVMAELPASLPLKPESPWLTLAQLAATALILVVLRMGSYVVKKKKPR